MTSPALKKFAMTGRFRNASRGILWPKTRAVGRIYEPRACLSVVPIGLLSPYVVRPGPALPHPAPAHPRTTARLQACSGDSRIHSLAPQMAHVQPLQACSWGKGRHCRIPD